MKSKENIKKMQEDGLMKDQTKLGLGRTTQQPCPLDHCTKDKLYENVQKALYMYIKLINCSPFFPM